MLVTADYSPAAKWNPDYDGLFTVRITSPNIKKTNELSFFITLSRFGQVKQLGIGTNIHGPQPVGPGPKKWSLDSFQQFYSDSNYNHVLVRYAKQIDAEKAIIAIDRSFFFSSWCRGKFRIFEKF